MSKYLKQHIKDWSREEFIPLEQYLFVRNGIKGSKLKTGVSKKELQIFGIEMKKGWITKHGKDKFSIDIAKKAGAACMAIKDQDSYTKARIRMAFYMGDYDEQFIYLISNPATGMSKIGMSKSPEDRMKSLQTSCGHNLKMVAYWRVKDKASCVEADLHRKLHFCRMQGEWFRSEDITPEFIEENMTCDFYKVYPVL